MDSKAGFSVNSSFLTGLPVPQLFFYRTEQGRFEVIDGQQRLISIISYLNGYFGPEKKDGRRSVSI
jgi:uncharacterized protein with ParB-like and HNH nuclease domain